MTNNLLMLFEGHSEAKGGLNLTELRKRLIALFPAEASQIRSLGRGPLNVLGKRL